MIDHALDFIEAHPSLDTLAHIVAGLLFGFATLIAALIAATRGHDYEGGE